MSHGSSRCEAVSRTPRIARSISSSGRPASSAHACWSRARSSSAGPPGWPWTMLRASACSSSRTFCDQTPRRRGRPAALLLLARNLGRRHPVGEQEQPGQQRVRKRLPGQQLPPALLEDRRDVEARLRQHLEQRAEVLLADVVGGHERDAQVDRPAERDQRELRGRCARTRPAHGRPTPRRRWHVLPSGLEAEQPPQQVHDLEREEPAPCVGVARRGSAEQVEQRVGVGAFDGPGLLGHRGPRVARRAQAVERRGLEARVVGTGAPSDRAP